MANSQVDIQLIIKASIDGRTFDGILEYEKGIRINGICVINNYDIEKAVKDYILRNCDDEEILKLLSSNERDRYQLAYNSKLSHEMADSLAEEMFNASPDGIYPYELCVLLQNPCLSGKKIDQFAHRLIDKYEQMVSQDGNIDYELIFLLKYIAQNPNIWESTLEALKHSEIPLVVDAAKR